MNLELFLAPRHKKLSLQKTKKRVPTGKGRTESGKVGWGGGEANLPKLKAGCTEAPPKTTNALFWARAALTEVRGDRSLRKLKKMNALVKRGMGREKGRIKGTDNGREKEQKTKKSKVRFSPSKSY